jgi:hypothetical protein
MLFLGHFVTLGTCFDHSAIPRGGGFRENVTLTSQQSKTRIAGTRIWEKHMQSFAKVALYIVGCLSFLVAIIVALIVLDMIQHPRGVGMEWLAGPLFGLFGLALIIVGVICIRVAIALKKRPIPTGYAKGSEVIGR